MRYKRGGSTKNIPSTDPNRLIYFRAPLGPPTVGPTIGLSNRALQSSCAILPKERSCFGEIFFLLPGNVGFPHLSSTLMAFSTAFLPRLSPPPLFSPSPSLSFSPSQPPLPTLCTRRTMWNCGQSTDFPRTVVVCCSSDLVPQPNSKGLRTQASSIMPFDLTTDEAAMVRSSYKWRRVLLKVSGEALAGDHTENIDPKITMSIAREVASVTRLGIEIHDGVEAKGLMLVNGNRVAIVVGGGNIFRGSAWAGCSGLDRSSADYIGMLATVMNAIFLQATMESIGIPTRVQTAFRMSEVAEPYIRRRAVRHLEKGRVVIFAAGTGNPFFTTDTAAALRCAEINAEVVLKATNVDGVYDKDPKLYPDAFLHDTLSYDDVTSKDLSVMDMTAVTLCQENNIPVVVFNLNKSGNISKAILGEMVGTIIGGTWN